MSVKIIRISRPYYQMAQLYRNIENRFQEKPVQLIGRFPFTATYTVDGKKTEMIQLREYDCLHMQNHRSPETTGYLGLILRAKAGDPQARKILAEHKAGDYDFIQAYDPAKVDLGGYDEYLVPSTTRAEFTPREVSHKGYNLLRLSRMGFPVPSFCIMKTNMRGLVFWKKCDVREHALRVLEQLTGRKFNDPADPLVFSLRSALPENLPGLMPTYLNLGATNGVFPALIERYGESGAYDVRIHHLMTLMLRADPVENHHILEKMTKKYPDTLEKKKRLLIELENIIGATSCGIYRDDSQYSALANTIHYYYFDNRELFDASATEPHSYPAMILQEMMVGKLPHNSFSGVLHTREPRLGKGSQLIVARQAFGEEIMTGQRTPEDIRFSSQAAVKAYSLGLYYLYPQMMDLEREIGAPLSFEIAQQDGVLCALQMNKTALSGPAAFVVVPEMLLDKKIKRSAILELIQPYHVRQLLADRVIVPKGWKEVATGNSILPRGEICAKVYFSKEAALNARNRGEKAILVLESFNPSDVDTMIETQGLVSISEIAVHVTEIARRYGIISIVGLKQGDRVPKIEGDKLIFANGRVIEEGDHIVISSEDGKLYKGKAESEASKIKKAYDGEKVKMSAEERKLLKGFELFVSFLKRIRANEVKNASSLSNLANFLGFLGNEEKAKDIVNKWFEMRVADFVQYYLDTRIGKHRARINLFRLLTLDKQRRLIQLIIGPVKQSTERGTFILGRLILACEEDMSEQLYYAFISNFSDAEINILEQEKNKAKEYLEISTVQEKTPPKPPSPKPEPADHFMESLKRQVGRDMGGLTEEQVAQVRRHWDMDPDPLHKSHKVIKAALAKLGLKKD